MLNAAETFAVQLARASKRGQRHLRGLSRADRDDVIADAILMSWEEREQFDAAAGSLDNWFAERVRRARRRLKRDRPHVSITELNEPAAPDDVERTAITRDMVEQKLRAGLTKRKLARLLGELPPLIERPATPTRAPLPRNERAPIDHAIEKMLRRPSSERADCPVCWRCCYFQGLTPKRYAPPKIVDPEIRAAVTATEARKIIIAGGREP